MLTFQYKTKYKKYF